MSLFLDAVAVDLGRVKAALGSKDETVVRAVVSAFKGRFDDIDRIDRDNPLTVEKALTQMIMGEKLDDRNGYVYGYALEYLCMHLGRQLTSNSFTSMHLDWVDTVDSALGSAGVHAFDLVGDLTGGNEERPVSLPEIDEYPAIGFVKYKTLRRALKEFQEADLSDLDDEVQDAVREIQSWVEECCAEKWDLVCWMY